MSGSSKLELWRDDGTNIFPKNDREILPQANDGAGLGSATVSFSDLFLASGGVVNWANGDVTITHGSNVLTFNSDVSLYQAVNDGNPVLNIGSSATEKLAITAEYASGTQTLQTLTFNTLTVSATTDYGSYVFKVDEVQIFSIHDDRVSIVGNISFDDASNRSIMFGSPDPDAAGKTVTLQAQQGGAASGAGLAGGGVTLTTGQGSNAFAASGQNGGAGGAFTVNLGVGGSGDGAGTPGAQGTLEITGTNQVIVQNYNATFTPAGGALLNINVLGKDGGGSSVEYGGFAVGTQSTGAGTHDGYVSMQITVAGSANVDAVKAYWDAGTSEAVIELGGHGVANLVSSPVTSDVAGATMKYLGQAGGDSTSGAGYDSGDAVFGADDASDAFSGDTNGGNGGDTYIKAGVGGALSGGGSNGTNGIIRIAYDGTNTFDINFINGLDLKKATASVAVTAAATITIAVQVPSGAKIVGARIRVDTALAGGELWDAAYATGSTQAIATAQAVAQNTKVKKFFDANAATDIASAATDIAITKNGGGSFTAQGSFTGEVYYYTFEDIASV